MGGVISRYYPQNQAPSTDIMLISGHLAWIWGSQIQDPLKCTLIYTFTRARGREKSQLTMRYMTVTCFLLYRIVSATPKNGKTCFAQNT